MLSPAVGVVHYTSCFANALSTTGWDSHSFSTEPADPTKPGLNPPLPRFFPQAKLESQKERETQITLELYETNKALAIGSHYAAHFLVDSCC